MFFPENFLIFKIALSDPTGQLLCLEDIRKQHTASAWFKTKEKLQLKPVWLFKNTDLEKETFFLNRPEKWWSDSLVVWCFSSNQKKLPVVLFYVFACSVCGISLVDFMMQHPSSNVIPVSHHHQSALYVIWTCRAQKLQSVFTEQDVHLFTQACHQESNKKVQLHFQF